MATGALNWLCGPPSGSFDAEVKLRYRQPGQPARVSIREDGTAWIEFATPQRAATPGQFAVFYQDDAYGKAGLEGVSQMCIRDR